MCFYCKQPDHQIANCPKLEKKQTVQDTVPRPVSLARADSKDVSFAPFTFIGDVHGKKVTILRDTGASLSLVLKSVVKVGSKSFTGKFVNLKGVCGKATKIPLHRIDLNCNVTTGTVVVGVVKQLPIDVDVILGNDLAGDRVSAVPVMNEKTTGSDVETEKLKDNCRAMSKKKTEESDVSDCVKPVPKSNSGYEYLLTSMDPVARFPEAIPLRKITAKAVTTALMMTALMLRLMTIVIHGIKNCRVYIDDVVLFHIDWDEHLRAMRELFERLSAGNSTVNWSKCDVAQGSVDASDVCAGAVLQWPDDDCDDENGDGLLRPVSLHLSREEVLNRNRGGSIGVDNALEPQLG